MDLQGDKVARLYKKYSRLLLKDAIKHTDDPHLANEAVSDTFEKVMKRVEKIDETDEKRTGGLLIVMCRQSVAKLYKQKCRSVGISMAEPPDSPTEADEVVNAVLQRSSTRDIDERLSWLDETYRVPFIMFCIDEIPVSKIAQRLGISENTVYTRVHRAKRKIREWLDLKGGTLL